MSFIFYFQILPSAFLIRPLRRVSGFILTCYFVAIFIAIAGFVVLGPGRLVLSNIVLQIGSLTQVIVDQVHNYNAKIDFSTLFPIIAGLVGTISISALGVSIRIIGWIFSWLTSYGPYELRRERQFTYLTSPAYVSLLTSQLEKHLQTFYSNTNIRELCIVADGEGILVSYDVLSHMRNGKDKRSLLVSYNATMVGMYVLPDDDTWLTINSDYWGKFEKPLVYNMSWHHISSGYLRRADTISVRSPTGNLLAKVRTHKKNPFNKYKSLANCLVNWPNE